MGRHRSRSPGRRDEYRPSDRDRYEARRRDERKRLREDSRERGHYSRYRDREDDYRSRDHYDSRKRFRRDDTPPRRSYYDDRRRESGRLTPNRDEVRDPFTPLRTSPLNEQPSSRPSSRHTDSHPSSATKQKQEDPEIAEAKAKEARQAKLEAWKKKLEAQQREKSYERAMGSPQVTASKGTSASPVAGSPAPISQSTTGPASPSETGKSTPAPYSGKFDPKAIAKRAAAAMGHNKMLGADVVIPKSANNANNAGKFANGSQAASASQNGMTSPPHRCRVEHELTVCADSTIAGFGLNKLADRDATAAGKAGGALDEEEEVERKLEKLPDTGVNDIGDAALANDVYEAPDEGDAIRSDEEEAEKVREAAQKRAQEAQAEMDVDTPKTSNPPDTTMADAGEESDIDPLDAFMDALEHQDTSTDVADLKPKKQQRQVFNSDDEDELEAVNDADGDIIAITAAKRKKKDMPTVNHANVNYESFRKDFYSESIELAEMTKEEVDVLRADLDNIKCHGKDVPKPITKFAQGGFGAQILDVIRDQKFQSPTSIQCQALPAIMSGRDVVAVAKTGSGKTVAFILPMFRHVKDQRPVENLDGPIGLVLAPTRELATQIHRECKPYLKALNLRAVCAYGGAPIKEQIAELKRGAEIVVATPGRFIELLAANSGRVTNLRRVTYVVLDEADRMFDMGFEPQIMKILNNIRPDRQTVLFSATFPKVMEGVARKCLTKPVEIVVGGRSVVAAEITQIVEVRAAPTKFKRLLELLGEITAKDEDALTLVFVERQEEADNLFKELTRKGYPAVSVHGGREQIDRDDAIQEFKAGFVPVMVATSVAARGLDVKQLKLVVNYDCPNHLEDYVHRCGRTGRAGNTGTAVTFVGPEQARFASFLIKALTDSNQLIPDILKQMKKEHDEAVKSGNAKKVGSGFGGRGIERLDAARDAERAREKKQYKTGDEPDEEDDEANKTKDKKTSKVDEMVAKAAGAVAERDATTTTPTNNSPAPTPAPATTTAPQRNADVIPANLSTALSDAMKVQKVETPKAKPMKPNDPLAKVAAIAGTINKRVKPNAADARSGAPADNRGPDAGAFHAVLMVNDFPQKARWGVTNRTNVAKILDATGTSITNKGNYYKPGTEPGPGDPPKMYILVEADTEQQVQNAMLELTRLLKEGTVAALEAEARAGPSGRYSVV
jgi:ATP-dependent RNA helicase DDX46/PRP5